VAALDTLEGRAPWAVSPTEKEATTMHTITMTDSLYAAGQSAEVFNVTGRGVYNRSFRHQIYLYNSTGCCNRAAKLGEHMHMSAIASVIAAQPLGPRPTVLDIAIDDQIEIDGRLWVLRAQQMADPVLQPVPLCPICDKTQCPEQVEHLALARERELADLEMLEAEIAGGQ
jgi:hypothetical protein